MTRPALVRGDVVLTRFPFTDLKGSRVRPAVVSQGQIGEQRQRFRWPWLWSID